MRFGGVRDLRETHHRVALPDGQVDQERRHLADRLTRSRRIELRVWIDRHRRHCPHHRCRSRRLAARQQPVAQRAGDHRQHDVVHVAVVAGPQLAVVLQPAAGHGESPVPRHRGVQRTAGRGSPREGAGHIGEPPPDLDQLPGVGGHLGHRGADGRELHARARDPVADGAQHQSGGAGLARWDPDVLTERRRLLGAVGDDVPDLQRRHAVDQRLVRLGVDRDAVAGQPLDEIHLPQRPRLVQLDGSPTARRDHAAGHRFPARAMRTGGCDR